MKIGIIQNEQHKNTKNNIKTVLEMISQSVDKGAEFVCCREWFLGATPPDDVPNKLTDMISDICIKNKAVVATGNFRIQVDKQGRKFKQMNIIIDSNGKILLKQQKNNLYKKEKPWFVSGNELEHCDLDFGRVVVTSGIDSIDEKIYDQVKKCKPYLWVAQTNEHVTDMNADQREQLVDLYKKRSEETGCIIIVPMILGKLYGGHYNGKSFAIKNGNLICETDNKPRVAIFIV